MMEELKLLWEEHESGMADSRELDRKMLQRIIRSRSGSAVARIRRNIWFEIMVIVLPLWIGVSYNIYKETPGMLVWLPIGIPALFSLVFYGIKLRALKQHPSQELNLLQALRKQVWVMGRYLKIYSLIGLVLIPLLAGASLVWGFVYAAMENGQAISEVAWTSWLLLGGTIAIYAVLSHFFFKWYIKKLYGGHYQELLACLKELEFSENEG